MKKIFLIAMILLASSVQAISPQVFCTWSSRNANRPEGICKEQLFPPNTPDGETVEIPPGYRMKFENSQLWNLGKGYTIDLIFIADGKPRTILELEQSIRLSIGKNGVLNVSQKIWNASKETRWLHLSASLDSGVRRITISGTPNNKLRLGIDGKTVAEKESSGWNLCSAPKLYFNSGSDLRAPDFSWNLKQLSIYLGGCSAEELATLKAEQTVKEQKRNWRKVRESNDADFTQPGLINIAPLAVLSDSGTFGNPPWSVEAVVSAPSKEPRSRGVVNLDSRRGWNSGAYTAVDPDNPYFQLDFPFDEPVEITTCSILTGPKPTPEFRPPFLLERRLGKDWKTVFLAESVEDIRKPMIEFLKPFKADALRLRFINPSPNNYWGINRFWVYTKTLPSRSFRGGKFAVEAPGLPLTENEIVFASNAPIKLKCVYTPDKDNQPGEAVLVAELTDYYRHAIPGTNREIPLDSAKRKEYEFDFGPLPAGPYLFSLCLKKGSTVLLRGSQLFGIRGIQPVPFVMSQFPHISRPAFELTGGTGQPNGPAQRLSASDIDAYRKLNANAIQIEMGWQDLEPLPGVYNFSDLDRMVHYAAEQGFFVGISVYLGDNQCPTWLRQPRYVMRDQYGKPAWGRNNWKLEFINPPSVHSPLFREHFRELWKLIAKRYTPTGRIIRFDLRPPLLEAFYFDEYVNNLWNKGKTDNLWDFSEWSRLRFIEYLKEFRKFTLAEVNARYHTAFGNWNEVQLPKPASGSEAQRNDIRPAWKDFLDFKHNYTIANYYWEPIAEIAGINSDAQIFAPFGKIQDSRFRKLQEEKRLTTGNFSIELAGTYFPLRDRPENPPPVCFEWGAPVPPYSNFNIGLFYILPVLNGNSLRWVCNPCVGEEKYNDPSFWKSWESLGRLAKWFPMLSHYRLAAPARIALAGGFDLNDAKTDDARPIRHWQGTGLFDRWIMVTGGGVAAAYRGALFFNGQSPFEPLNAKSAADPEIKLILDGGNRECPAEEQHLALDFVKRGGKMLLWSNGFRFSGDNPSRFTQQVLGIDGKLDNADDAITDIALELPGFSPFRGKCYQVYPDVTVPKGKVVGTIGGQPAAWLIPYGKGEILFINALPHTKQAVDWAPFMEQVFQWAGTSKTYLATVANHSFPYLLCYALKNSGDGSFILAAFNDSDSLQEANVEYYKLLDSNKHYRFQLLHATDAKSKLVEGSRQGTNAKIKLLLSPLDLALIHVEEIP